MSLEGSHTTVRVAKWRRSAAAFTAGAALVTGCDTESAPPPPATATSSASDAAYALPRGVCFPEVRENPTREEAQRCLAARADGSTVAFVAFDGIDPQALQESAAAFEQTVRDATDGALQPEATVIQASLEAQAALDEEIDKHLLNCVGDVQASKAADTTMDDVRASDHVIGFTTAESCEKKHGEADPERRHADLFVEDLNSSKMRQEQGERAAHEYLHLYLLGHAGRIMNNTDQTLSSIDIQQPGAPLDINQFFSNPKYREYGDEHNIMGNNSFVNRTIESNPIQVDHLHWPEAELQGEQVLLGVAATTDKPAIIENIDDDRYAFVPIQTPLTFTSEKNDAWTFDRLAFVPKQFAIGDEVHKEVAMYLYNTDHSSMLAKIGDLRFKEGEQHFTIGGQVITVVLAGSSMTVLAEK